MLTCAKHVVHVFFCLLIMAISVFSCAVVHAVYLCLGHCAFNGQTSPCPWTWHQRSQLLAKSVTWNPKGKALTLAPAASAWRSQLCAMFFAPHPAAFCWWKPRLTHKRVVSSTTRSRVRRASRDLAAMKLCLLIVTRGRTPVELYKWWRCRSPLNLHAEWGVCDCPTPAKLFVTVVIQNSLAPSPQLKESQGRVRLGATLCPSVNYQMANSRWETCYESGAPLMYSLIFSVSFSVA